MTCVFGCGLTVLQLVLAVHVVVKDLHIAVWGFKHSMVKRDHPSQHSLHHVYYWKDTGSQGMLYQRASLHPAIRNSFIIPHIARNGLPFCTTGHPW